MIRLAMWQWSRGQRADPERHLDKAIEGMIEADRLVLEDPRLRQMMIANADELYRQGGRGLYDEALIMARPWGFPIEGVQTPVSHVARRAGHHRARSPWAATCANALPNAEATFYPTEGHHLVYDRWREILARLRRGQPGRDLRLPSLTDGSRRLARRTMAGHEGRCLGATLEVQLGQDRAHVVLDRLVRQEHLGRDLAVGLALGDQQQDPALLRRSVGPARRHRRRWPCAGRARGPCR